MSKPAERPAPSPARRERLVVAAETLFSRHGLRAVTMAAIAAEAGLAKATVYAYFPDKEALF
ncbi:MAG: TetR/AcrR family transcriptional regulator, partial [Gammaproteobacteria bacterium]